MKAKVFRLDEIPERFWHESGDYPNAETCNSYSEVIEIRPSVIEAFKRCDNIVRIGNPNEKYYMDRKMLCYSLGDYLYLIKAEGRGPLSLSPVLWRIKWDLVDIVSPGMIEIRKPGEGGDPE